MLASSDWMLQHAGLCRLDIHRLSPQTSTLCLEYPWHYGVSSEVFKNINGAIDFWARVLVAMNKSSTNASTMLAIVSSPECLLCHAITPIVIQQVKRRSRWSGDQHKQGVPHSYKRPTGSSILTFQTQSWSVYCHDSWDVSPNMHSWTPLFLGAVALDRWVTTLLSNMIFCVPSHCPDLMCLLHVRP